MTDPTGPGSRTAPRRTDTDDPRRSREQAVKILFQADVRNVSGEDVLAKLVDDPHARAILDDTEGLVPEPTSVDGFARALVTGVVRDRDEVDRLISRFARRWQISRMPVVDRTVLRLATYELLHEPTPAAVVIDEAITLVKDLSTEDSGRYVNGVLDAIRKELAKRPATPERTVADVGDQLLADDPVDEHSESEPVASEPVASEPATSEPATSEPTADEPAPSEPTADEPAPSEPSSSQPTPTELGPSEPSTIADGAAGAADDAPGAPDAKEANDAKDADSDAAAAAALDDAGAASSTAAGTDAAGTEAAGTDAAGTDAVGTDAAGTDAAGTDAAGPDAAGTDAADGVAEEAAPDLASHPETLFDPDIFAAPGASSDAAASSDPDGSSDAATPSDPGTSSDPAAPSDPAKPSAVGTSGDDPAEER